MFNKLIKILVALVIFYQTPVHSKSASFNDFNSKDLTNYFSGIIAYENKDNTDALKFFNASKVLINKHDIYLRRYVLLGYNPMLKYKVFYNMDESLLDQPYTLATYMLKLGKTENEYKDNLNAFPNTLSFSLFHECSFFQISGSKMIPYLCILS